MRLYSGFAPANDRFVRFYEAISGKQEFNLFSFCHLQQCTARYKLIPAKYEFENEVGLDKYLHTASPHNSAP